jgi:hypothetical protein
MPLTGGEESLVSKDVCCWYSWAVAPTGIYYLNRNASANGTIEFLDFATRRASPILPLDKPPSLFGGLALSPDGKSLLFGENELDESYIMLMKNFR